MSWVVVQGNALDLPLADNSVDLVVTSPPYFALRSYRDGGEHYDGQVGSEETPEAFLESLWAATREMMRVLKPFGSLWVNLGDKYSAKRTYQVQHGGLAANEVSEVGQDTLSFAPAKSLMGLPWRYAIGCIDQLGLILRAEVIWSKPNGLPESVTDRVRRSHEQFFHFTLEPRYFSAVDEIREPYLLSSWTAQSDKDGATQRGKSGIRSGPKGLARAEGLADGQRLGATSMQGAYDNPLGRLPGSVWTVPTEPLVTPDHLGDHFAAFPQEWPRRIILGWSPSGVCVECGEGRRPVVDRTTTGKDNSYDGRNRNTADVKAWKAVKAENPDRITGYACACPEPSAPTRPAVVLDPFGGTGTVAGVAHTLGRHGISVDLSADYCRLARWRIRDSGHFTKSEQRTWADRQEALL